jgi:aminoglycoside phosphotransferase (APT) family kinase protein
MVFPAEAVDTYLRRHLSDLGALRSVRKFDVGQSNPTYRLAMAHGHCVLRAKPAGDMRGLAGADRRALGIPTEEEYVAEYCAYRGVPGILQWNFYLAASLFRLAGICQGIYRRGLEGNASSSEALGFGHKTDVVADLAINILTGPHNA